MEVGRSVGDDRVRIRVERRKGVQDWERGGTGRGGYDKDRPESEG